MFKVSVKGIEWDTEVDGKIQHPRLPKSRTWKVEAPWLLEGGKPDANTYSLVLDMLSDKYGWCIHSTKGITLTDLATKQVWTL